jgi:hypothetical protein
MAKPRNYKSEYANYQGKPDQIKKRSMRNQARALMAKKGLVHKGDGKDVDHAKAIAKGGGNGNGNLRVKSKSANRSFPRTRTGGMK